jgi:hypothetical protein
LLVVVDPYSLASRDDGHARKAEDLQPQTRARYVYLPPAATQFETSGSVTVQSLANGARK